MKKPARAGDIDLEPWCGEQTVYILFSHSMASITGSLGVIIVLAVALSFQPVSMSALGLWSISGIAIGLSRLALRWGYFNHAAKRPPTFWLNGYRLTTLASGVLNGVCVWLFFTDVSAAHQLLMLFSIAGLTAAATGTHAIDRFTFKSFMYSACVLALGKILLLGEPTHYALSLMFVFYILVMERTGRHNRSILLDNLTLTHKMQYRATHDPLVGLLNREEFENQFESRLTASRHGVAILFIDLDNFKQLNDKLGHQAGDEALMQVSNIIRAAIRQDDISARLGGDEFVVALLLDDPQEAINIAEEIRQNVGKISFLEDGIFAGLTASIGLAFHHNNQVGFSRLMHTADLACYQSKDNGRNQISFTLID